MGEVGIFSEDDRVELLDGEILEMTPIGSRHAACVDRLNRILTSQLRTTAIVRIQNPIRLNDRSEPQPDIAVLQPRADFYEQAHPGPPDVLLLIEVIDSSSELDQRVKLPLYAKAGMREVWLVNLEERTIYVYRRPSQLGYQETKQVQRADRLTAEALPLLTLNISEVFPSCHLNVLRSMCIVVMDLCN